MLVLLDVRVDNRRVALSALFDLSAECNCVNYDILLQRLFDLGVTVFDWLRSFLTETSQQFSRDGGFSDMALILFNVRQEFHYWFHSLLFVFA